MGSCALAVAVVWCDASCKVPIGREALADVADEAQRSRVNTGED